MHTQIRAGRYVATLLLALLGAACSADTGHELRIGTNLWVGYEPLYLARSQGDLRNTGIRLIEYPSSTETMNALRSGGIEAGALTLDEAITLARDGIDLRVVLLMDISNGADAVIVHSDIKSPQDLRGKRIGVESSAVGGYMIDRMLHSFSLTLDDVHIVPLTADEQEQAFESGKVDAVVTFEPIRSRLLEHGGRVIFDSSQIPGEIIDVLAVRNQALENSPQALNSLGKAWFNALDYMHHHPDAALHSMQARLHMPGSQLQIIFRGLQLGDRALNRSFFDNRSATPVKKAARLVRVMQKNGLLDGDVDVARLFDAAPLADRSQP